MHPVPLLTSWSVTVVVDVPDRSGICVEDVAVRTHRASRSNLVRVSPWRTDCDLGISVPSLECSSVLPEFTVALQTSRGRCNGTGHWQHADFASLLLWDGLEQNEKDAEEVAPPRP